MSSKPSRKSQKWAVGSLVTLKNSSTGDRIQGMVDQYSPRPTAAGWEIAIKDATVWRVDGSCKRKEIYACNLDDITDDQGNNGGEGSSSKSVEGKGGVKST